MSNNIPSGNNGQSSTIVIKSSRVIDADTSFLELTGYTIEELLGIDIFELMNKILRSNLNPAQLNLSKPENTIIFSKSLTPIEVFVRLERDPSQELKYLRFEAVIPRVEDKFTYLRQFGSEEMLCTAIFSKNNFQMLHANTIFISFLPEPYNSSNACIGLNTYVLFNKSGDLSALINHFKDTVLNKKTINLKDFKLVFPDKSYSYWDMYITPVVEDDCVKYIVLLAKNVTDRILSQRKIEDQSNIIIQQKEQLEAIIENMTDALFIFDRNSNYILLNKAAREYMNYVNCVKREDWFSATEFYDMDGNAIHPKDMPSSHIIKGESVYEKRMRIKNSSIDRYVVLKGAPLLDTDGDFNIGIYCISDLTKYVIYEKALKEQRDHFNKIINILNIPLIRLSFPELNIIEINNKAKQDLPCTQPSNKSTENGNDAPFEGAIQNLPLLSANDSLDCFEKIKNIKSTIALKKVELTRNGDKFYYNVIFQPLMNVSDEIEEVLVIFVDITKETLENESLEKLSGMKDEFLMLISHEFKTPLTVISSALQAMEYICRDELTDRMKSYLNKIKQNTLRQLRLVNNLLDITKANAGHFKLHLRDLDIIELTRSVLDSVSIYAQQKGVSLVFTPCVSKKVIGIDEEKYDRILMNLLSNAIKFTPKDKTIEVIASVVTVKRKRMFCLQVKDEGVGIPADKQYLIFKRFGQVDSSLTRQAEGTGIGLSLVKLLVDSLEGEVSLTSQEGKGSTFTVLLPSRRVNLNAEEKGTLLVTDNRLEQSIAIEFSDIYL